MEKLLVLPLVLLLAHCSNSKPTTGHKAGQDLQQGQTVTPQQSPATSINPGSTNSQASRQAPISQGIAGSVLWQSGNQMPSPGAPVRSSKRGVQRTVYVYELTNGSQAQTEDGVFHTNIRTKLVTKVETDTAGNFAISLPPGKYSLFTKEEQGLYANLFDGEMNIFPVEVTQGQVTTVEFLINYKAVY